MRSTTRQDAALSLFRALGTPAPPWLTHDADDADAAPGAADGWAACGGAALTAGGLVPPGDVAARLRAAALAARVLGRMAGSELVLDGPSLISERERLALTAHAPSPGRTLRGGGHLLTTVDGWVAVNLPREDDWDLVPALTLGTAAAGDANALARWAAGQRTAAIIGQATTLGLAVGAVTARPRSRPTPTGPAPFTAATAGQTPRPARRARKLAALTVLDLSRLWAGPLAGALLAEAGAHVVKLKSDRCPERPLPSDRAFADRLNGAKELLTADFADTVSLGRTVAEADIVIVAARARALTSLGLAPRPGQIWICISGHGGGGEHQRIAFGDDAAAEAGALCWDHGRPVFAGDALADPVTGLLGAVAALGMVATGRTGRADLTLAGSARWAVADRAA